MITPEMRDAVRLWAAKHLPLGVEISDEAVSELLAGLGVATILKTPLENIFREKRD